MKHIIYILFLLGLLWGTHVLCRGTVIEAERKMEIPASEHVPLESQQFFKLSQDAILLFQENSRTNSIGGLRRIPQLRSIAGKIHALPLPETDDSKYDALFHFRQNLVRTGLYRHGTLV